MSDRLTRWLCENSGELSTHEFINENGIPKAILTGQRLRLLLSLLGHANDDYMVWCSVKTYMREAKLNSQSTQDHLKLLEQMGWIRKDGQQPSNTGRPSIRYEITLPNQPPKELYEPLKSVNNSQVVPEVVLTQMPTQMPTGKHLTRTKTRTTHTAERTSSAAAERAQLKRVGKEYGKQALEKAQQQGQYIKTPEAWAAHMSKQVSTQEGDLYELALELIEQHPDKTAIDIAALLSPNISAPQAPIDPVLSAHMSMAGGLYLTEGLQVALEFAEGQGHYAPQLKVFLHNRANKTKADNKQQQGEVA